MDSSLSLRSDDTRCQGAEFSTLPPDPDCLSTLIHGYVV